MAQARTVFTRVVAPKRVEEIAAHRWDLFPYLLMVVVLITTVSTFHVWSRVRVIELNLGVAEASRLTNELKQENGRLKLEVASLKTPARIESLAKGELGMALPTDQQVIVVR